MVARANCIVSRRATIRPTVAFARRPEYNDLVTATDPITPGEPAPDFSLRATGSGREVGPGAGRPLVLVFHAQNAAFAVDRLNREVRQRYPEPGQLTVASVVDLSLVPPFFKPSAEMAMMASYRQAARSLPPWADPADYVTILPDWTGRVTRDYGASGAYLVPVLVVVGSDGRVLGRRAGSNILAPAALELLEGA